MKHWATSLALHGAVLGLATVLWLEPAVRTEAPTRWQVAFAPSPAPSPVQPALMPPRLENRPLPPRPPVPVPLAQPLPAPPPTPVVAPVLSPPASPAAAVSTPVPAGAEKLVPAVVPAVSAPVAPPPVAAPASRPDAAVETERRWYQALLERLRAMKRYPLAARRLEQEGVVLIEARIGADGRVEAAEIRRGSGYPILDRDALKLLESAAESVRGQQQPERPARLEIPIVYRLEN